MRDEQYDGHNRKAGHAKALRAIKHRRTRRVMRALLMLTIRKMEVA